jgi:hypothetical protein
MPIPLKDALEEKGIVDESGRVVFGFQENGCKKQGKIVDETHDKLHAQGGLTVCNLEIWADAKRIWINGGRLLVQLVFVLKWTRGRSNNRVKGDIEIFTRIHTNCTLKVSYHVYIGLPQRSLSSSEYHVVTGCTEYYCVGKTNKE